MCVKQLVKPEKNMKKHIEATKIEETSWTTFKTYVPSNLSINVTIRQVVLIKKLEQEPHFHELIYMHMNLSIFSDPPPMEKKHHLQLLKN